MQNQTNARQTPADHGLRAVCAALEEEEVQNGAAIYAFTNHRASSSGKGTSAALATVSKPPRAAPPLGEEANERLSASVLEGSTSRDCRPALAATVLLPSDLTAVGDCAAAAAATAVALSTVATCSFKPAAGELGLLGLLSCGLEMPSNSAVLGEPGSGSLQLAAPAAALSANETVTVPWPAADMPVASCCRSSAADTRSVAELLCCKEPLC